MTITIDAPQDLVERVSIAAKRQGVTVEEYTLRALWQSSELFEPEQDTEQEQRKRKTLAAILAGRYATKNPEGSSEAFIVRKADEIAREDKL